MYNDVLESTSYDEEEWLASREQMQDVSDRSKTIRTSGNT
jgi:hypothetical protein